MGEDELPCQQLGNAALSGDAEECQRLLESGTVKDVNWKRPDDGNTALHLAAEEGHMQVVKLLLAAGADPEKTNSFFLTAFAIAPQGSRVEALLAGLTKPLGEE